MSAARRGHGRQPRRGGAGSAPGGRSGQRRTGRSVSDRSGRDDDGAPIRTHLVGVVERAGKLVSVAPLFERGRRIAVHDARGAKPGQLVVVRTGAGTKQPPKVDRVLGDPSVARDVLEGLMIHRGLARRFPPGVAKAAALARERALTDDPAGGSRVDLRDLPTFTIDPTTAKDFDDAISALRLDDGCVRIWVHIADVSAFVRPGSPVDRVAMERGTSVYVPGKVEPMLPEALSNEACSLVPGEDRLAVTVEMDFDGAEVVRAAFHRSLIRSDERLDYDRVDRILEGHERGAEPWGTPLDAAREVAAALDARRAERGRALTVESSEPEFTFDRKGHVAGLTPSISSESHRLIEHLMIAANEQVATVLTERRVPTLYRVHEQPDPPRVELLVAKLASLGVPVPELPDQMTPRDAADLVALASRLVDAHVRSTGHGRAAYTSLVLRSLKQATYSPEPLGHAGLGSDRYCHFTSPIRRSPDLVCHRALLSVIGAGEDAPKAAHLEEAGLWASGRERDAMQIERAADDVARAFLLERRIFEGAGRRDEATREFDGEVVGVIGAGAFVTFGDGFEGMIPVRKLGDDWWELNAEGTVLYAAGRSSSLKLGDPIRVRVCGIDPARGRVDLEPVAT